MIQRILVVGAAVILFAAAVIANLAIADVVTMSALRDSLGRIVSIVAVTTIATALIVALAKLAMKK